MTPPPRGRSMWVTGLVVAALLVSATATAVLVLSSDDRPRDTARPAVTVPPDRTAPIPTTTTGPSEGAAPEGEAPEGTAPESADLGPQGIPSLVEPDLALREGPVAVPLELVLPSLDLRSDVLGVGLTRADVMDAPMSADADDPVWQQTFWYRGSARPGMASTALIAGHVGDPLGRPGPFARLGELRPGDVVVVRDTRDGTDLRYTVTEVSTHTLEEASEPALLERIYGAGPVAGTDPQPSTDGLAHLTLITCAGTFRGETHDHRLVVSAVRDV